MNSSVLLSFNDADEATITTKLTALKNQGASPSALHFDNCPIDTLQFLISLELTQELRELTISRCYYLHSIQPLQYCTNLVSLKLQSLLLESSEFEHVRELKNMQRLYIDYINDLINLDFLHELYHLEDVAVTRCTQIQDISSLSKALHLKKLSLAATGSTHLQDLSVISHLKKLESLDLSNLVWISSLDFLTGLHHLSDLTLNFIENLEDIQALEHLTKLQSLHLKGCHLIEPQLPRLMHRHFNHLTLP